MKKFYGLADIPTIFQEHLDKILEFKYPAWLDDISIVTKGNKLEHKKDLESVLIKLQDEGFKLSETKSEIFKNEIQWIGHKINQAGIKPMEDNLQATFQLKEPQNGKELKSFLGAIQYLSKAIENLSSNKDKLRQLLKKEKNLGLD